MTSPSGYKFPILNSDGTTSLSYVPYGFLYSVGRNDYGELGNNTTVYYSSPIQIGSLSTWKQIFSGYYTLTAIKTDGTLWAWGFNTSGQLGNGTTTNYSSPVQIGALTNWSQVSGAFHTAAVKTDGTLWTWGYNGNGQLGNGTTTPYSSPIQVGALTNWKQVSAGSFHTAAVKTDGSLWTWGSSNFGQLGNGVNNVNYFSPIQVGSSTNWTQIACGHQHTLAVKTDGSLWTWGSSNFGQLGNGTTTAYSSPIQIGALTNWYQVVANYNDNSYALKTDGTLWSWGYNLSGQAGNDTSGFNFSSPVQIGLLTNWTQIACGYLDAIAIKSDGTAWAWGSNPGGELGNGTTVAYSSPIQVGSLTNWQQVACGYSSSFLIQSAYQVPSTIVDMSDMFVPKDLFMNDGLWSWGSGTGGQLGNGTSTNYSSPILVGSLTTWKDLAAYYSLTNSAAAIKIDGTLWTWGSNPYGQLANSTTVSYSSPIQIGSLTNWKQVTMGQYHLHAIKTDGTLWSCGYNNAGRLGNNSQQLFYSSPIQIGLLTNWKYAAAGQYHGIAIKIDGTLWSWGFNTYGQLGNNTTVSYSSPIQVGALTDWKTICTEAASSLAIKIDGTLWSWGFNIYGELGNSTTVSYSSPIQVGLLTNWRQVSLGGNYSMAIKTDGTLWSWGKNDSGQLGNGTVTSYSSPIQVGSLTNWKQVACGYTHVTAAKTDGTLWVWGKNDSGQLGNGTTVYYSSPIQVGSLNIWRKVSNISAGSFAIISPDLYIY